MFERECHGVFFLSSNPTAKVFKESLKKFGKEDNIDIIDKIRTDMEASCRLLRESRLTHTAEILNQIF
jgi:hypothetical protein